MARLTLVHWSRAEAGDRVERLRGLGHQVAVLDESEAAALRAVRKNPPEAFLIDLSRSPSRGRDLGIWLRQARATRSVPLIFLGGEPEAVARARCLLPDADFIGWAGIRGALRRALAKPPGTVAVPGMLDGYSGTPLPKKLGIAPGARVVLRGAPPGFEAVLGELPEGVRLSRATGRGAAAAVVLQFCRSRAALAQGFDGAAKAVTAGGRLWLLWPKKSSRLAGDLGQLEVRAFGLERDWVDYKICAVDADWSGLCFARRKDPGARSGRRNRGGGAEVG